MACLTESGQDCLFGVQSFVHRTLFQDSLQAEVQVFSGRSQQNVGAFQLWRSALAAAGGRIDEFVLQVDCMTLSWPELFC
mmetsp:Transcript_37039/g.69068  ORF Transcript_37039/g.69068 Transcript_37039/m.69068 type:complete len:80 (-) Transcript_37039:69-308(-)